MRKRDEKPSMQATDTPSNPPTAAALPAIPLVDLGGAGPAALLAHAPHQLAHVLDACHRLYGRVPLAIGDRLTQLWLEQRRNPYRQEIAAIAREIGRVGVVMLNLSYEWACTSGVAADPETDGNRMLRTLDWPTAGLGRNVVISAEQGEAGLFYNVTWPGFVGVLTAMAPGRFSAAINQPPLYRYTPVTRVDWLIGRARVWRQDGLPPVHLLRQVFERCRTYDEALAMLRSAPVCAPVFYTLSGVGAGEGCVIERTETAARVHAGPETITNHWLGFAIAGHDRDKQTRARREQMAALIQTAANDFSWLTPPMLNPTTRVAVIANAAAGRLQVQGWEASEAATGVFSLPTVNADDKRQTTAGSAPALPA